MSTVLDNETCSTCKWWTRIDAEHGECARYAPPITVVSSGQDRIAQRPITPQYWVACGDYVKV